jgi:hypothetical protein
MTAGLPVGRAACSRARVTLIALLVLASSGTADAARRLGDTRPPSVSIETPTQLSIYSTTTAAVTLAGRASDNRRVAQVTWESDRGYRGKASGTGSWSASAIPLLGGNNRIVVRATDSSGNSATDVIDVELVVPAPVVVEEPASESTSEPVSGTETETGSVSEPVSDTESTATADSEPQPAVNQPPMISGTPEPSVRAGESYTFTPVASDPEGDALVFSINGAPAWAQFDSRTGTLSGVPGSADVGFHEGIVITVADGSGYASLPAFSLAVMAPIVGSATVNWNPPLQRIDGSVLDNLAAYRIRYGQNASALEHAVRLDNAGLTSYVIEGLQAGTWYFSMTAIDAAGLESAPSSMAAKTIQ